MTPDTSEPTVLIRDGRIDTRHSLHTTPDLATWLGGNDGRAARLPNDVDLDALAPRLGALDTILVDFPTFTDGRGFSIARQLRTQYGYTGDLVADGPLIPDQYSMALQCGFDAVTVDQDTFARQSESNWRDAMAAFDLTYQRGYARLETAATSIFDARDTATKTRRGGSPDPFDGLSAEDALRAALARFSDDICLVSSFGVDSGVLLHMASRIRADLPIFFLDTGKHFRETLHYRDMLTERLGLTNVVSIAPDPVEVAAEDPDGTLNWNNPDACCNLRKVRPLDRRISGFAARITGRKRYQTRERADMATLEIPTGHGEQAKINPLAAWTAKDVTAYLRRHDIPPHPLLALGYLSIGCQPCTTRVSEGEDPRAGRWRNAPKTECGIHLVDGKWESTESEKRYEVF